MSFQLPESNFARYNRKHWPCVDLTGLQDDTCARQVSAIEERYGSVDVFARWETIGHRQFLELPVIVV